MASHQPDTHTQVGPHGGPETGFLPVGWAHLILAACLSLLPPGHAAAQSAGTRQIAAQDFHSGGIQLEQPWLFRPGGEDGPQAVGYPDADWALRRTALESGDWGGSGWFRLHLDLAPDLQSRPLAILIRQLGASEIFVDGRRQHTLGRVGASPETELPLHFAGLDPLSIHLDPGPHHVIAVRYSNFEALTHRRLGWLPGFEVRLVPADGPAADFRRTHGRLQIFLTSVASAFGVLHLLLYGFYPKSRENLFFALHTLSIAAAAYLTYELQVVSLDRMLAVSDLHRIGLVVAAVTGLSFIYSLFDARLPRQFWPFAVAGGAVALWSLGNHVGWVHVFVLLSLVEWLRVILGAAWQRRPGAHIVGAGALLFVAAIAYQILQELGIFEGGPVSLAYPFGTLALLLAMSVNLARRFGHAHRDLEEQLHQVQALSNQLEEKVEERTRELRDAQAQLIMREKMASLGDLVAGVAHELNTPVGAVRSAADVLARCVDSIRKELAANAPGAGSPDGRLERVLGLMADNTRLVGDGSGRIERIVRSLRAFVRLDEAALQEIDLHEALDVTLALMQHEFGERIRVVRNYGNDVPRILCYAGELNQVFVNLLMNATQAIQGEGAIDIRTAHRDGRVTVRIADTGHGISAGDIERVFEPGFTTRGANIRLGMGLPLCYSVITKHHGSITVDSEEGKGATFTVELPVSQTG